MTLLPYGDGTDWVYFDFSDLGLVLPMGDYVVGMHTPHDRAGALRYSINDVHPGSRHSYWNGVWNTGGVVSDMVFQATWADPAAIDPAGWGRVKSLYR